MFLFIITDEFLTDKEKKKIQSTYEKFLSTAKPAVLVQKFYGEGLMGECEKQKIDNTPEHKRAEVLFSDVIYRSTYPVVSSFLKHLHCAIHLFYQ